MNQNLNYLFVYSTFVPAENSLNAQPSLMRKRCMQVKTTTLMKVSFLSLFLTFTYASFGQIKISGTIKKSDSSILSYVNIGIKLKNVGTVSNESGQFGLEIPKQFLKDTLTFSYVGFEELSVPIQSIIHSSIHDFCT